jgi:hypothetical protein
MTNVGDEEASSLYAASRVQSNIEEEKQPAINGQETKGLKKRQKYSKQGCDSTQRSNDGI